MKRAQQIILCNDAWKDILLYKVIHLYISVIESFEIPYKYTIRKNYPKYINDRLIKIQSTFLNGSKISNKSGIFQYYISSS